MEKNLIDASVLKNNNAQRRYVQDYIEGILQTINSNLKDAKIKGDYFIIAELPIIFDIPHVLNRDAQRMVYSKVLDVLKKKNYTTVINYSIDICKIKISWLNPEEERLIQHQLKIIKDNTGQF